MNETFSRAKFEKYCRDNLYVEISKNWIDCDCPLANWTKSMGYEEAHVDPMGPTFIVSSHGIDRWDDLSEEFDGSWAQTFAYEVDLLEENEEGDKVVIGDDCLDILSKIPNVEPKE